MFVFEYFLEIVQDLLSVRSKLKLVGIIQMNPNETSKLILFMALIDKGWRIGF